MAGGQPVIREGGAAFVHTAEKPFLYKDISQDISQDFSKICPRYAQDMPNLCQRYHQDMPKL